MIAALIISWIIIIGLGVLLYILNDLHVKYVESSNIIIQAQKEQNELLKEINDCNDKIIADFEQKSEFKNEVLNLIGALENLIEKEEL